MNTFYKKAKGFTIVEVMIVLVVLGVMTAVAIPSYIKRMHTQRLDSAANQLMTHIRQARQRATKEKVFYRLNFKELENGYYLESCPLNSINDNEWSRIKILGHDKEEGIIGSGEVDSEHVILLPKDIRVSMPDKETSKMLVIFTPSGKVDPNYLPINIELASLANSKKLTVNVNLVGFPRVE